jgi:hypothetical protein
MVNYVTYRDYVLNKKDIKKYSNYTRLLFNRDPMIYMVGYNIPTIDGQRWMPIFNHVLGRIKNRMNEEFFSNYHKRRINALHEIGFPLLAINKIEFYLLNSAHL